MSTPTSQGEAVMKTYEVAVSHTVRRTFAVQASSREEAEERAIADLPPAKFLDGWISDQEFDAWAFGVPA